MRFIIYYYIILLLLLLWAFLIIITADSSWRTWCASLHCPKSAEGVKVTLANREFIINDGDGVKRNGRSNH